MTNSMFDPKEVQRALRLLLPSGQVTELRVLSASTKAVSDPHTEFGFFDDVEKLLVALPKIESANGIYITLNPVDPGLLTRAKNCIKKAVKGQSTSDANVERRSWLLIDFDPRRPSGVSSTDAEHSAALEKAQIVKECLSELRWAEPIVADSGNGAHLLYRINLPVNDGGLVERTLAAIAMEADTDEVEIDRTVHNPARICKLYGTFACKGDATEERPHRMSRILSAPDAIQVVERGLMEELVADIEANSSNNNNGHAFDLASFIASNGFEVDGPESWQRGLRYVFRRSPMCEHHDGAAFIVQFPSGAMFAKCHHNSCDWDWADLRAKYDVKATGRGNSHARPMASDVPPYTPFPVDVLPKVVRAFVIAASTAIGCDPSFVALPLLCCLARAIGNKRVIRLKRGWDEHAIIWAAIVGKSGTHKTPAIRAATTFVERKQDDDLQQYSEALTDDDHKSDGERYVTSDITIEALAERLEQQFNGLLVVSDELAGWVNGIAQYKGGRGSDLGHWLACWSGEPMTVDRKSGKKKTIHVRRAAVSLVGGIQQGVLKAAIGQEHMHDGLCARLLLAMPEPRQVEWSEAVIDPPTEAAMAKLFDHLFAFEPATDERGRHAPLPMLLSTEAKTVWVEYYNRHSAEQIKLGDDLAAAWSKLEAYAARFALIFQLCSNATSKSDGDVIDETSMRAGIALADWFGREAMRVYGVLAEREADEEMRELVELIRRHDGRITARELAHATRRYRHPGDAQFALDSLAKAGWGEWQVETTEGRPRKSFVLRNGHSGNGNASW